MKFKAGMMAIILIAALAATGCPKKTTLDRIGAATVVGVNAYIGQLDGLKAEKVLSDAKYEQLTKQAIAIRGKAEKFRDKIAGLTEITPGDVKAIVSITGELLGLFDESLRDPDILNLPTDALALKILRGARLGISQAQLAVAVLFPDPTPTPAGAVTTASTVKIAPRGIAPKNVIVNLQ